MREIANMGRLLYFCAAVASVLWGLVASSAARPIAFLLAICIAIVVTPSLRLPQDDVVDFDVAPVTAVVALLPIQIVPFVVLAGNVIGQAIGHAVSYTHGKEPSTVAARVGGALAVAWIGQLISASKWLKSGVRGIPFLLVLSVMYACFDLAASAWHVLRLRKSSLVNELRRRLHLLGPFYAGQLCIGVAAVVVFPSMGCWSLAIMTMLSGILVNAFNMYLKIRRAYQQTVEALARVSALQFDYRDPEPERVADLAIRVGHRLNLSAAVLETLGYSALLHDIGRITDGEASGDAHASRGAEIVASIPFLAHIEPIVRLHHASVNELASCDDRNAICSSIIHLCDDYLRLADANKNICQLDVLKCPASRSGVLYRADVYEALSQVLSVEPNIPAAKVQSAVI